MSLTDLFKVNKLKDEIERLTAENAVLQEKANIVLTAQQMKPAELQDIIDNKTKEIKNLELEFESKRSNENKELDELNEKQSSIKEKIKTLNADIKSLKEKLVDTEDKVNMESNGLYEPRYDFASSLGYKSQLDQVRQDQKQMIRNELAAEIFKSMLLDNSAARGRSMQKKNIKQLLRTFNGECEAAINKITYSNLDRISNRIEKSFDQLNKLNDPNGVRLTPKYLDSKIDELHLAFEYSEKKQEEKEELREQREREREEKRAQKEIQDAQKQIDKELDHYIKAVAELKEKLATLDGTEKEDVQSRIDELQKNIGESEDKKKDLDYRAENATAGYVYIISNIGSFGPDVVKIGVTRRLDPLERIAELSSASVPFKFDVHALIFSYDAYKLETELHNKFADERINKVNARKEYFNVPISKIKDVLKGYEDLTVDFTENPDAAEYRETLALEKNKIAQQENIKSVS
ncbi:DUF4041 domain-containing protein [Lapidilactobacillus luobeiensis]|uniref:DUF4041 domain-containing protein n=1 Tax=Lapidilactobacillus luobeiensis TaxID=2950371 RepID=UPI0021C2D214|nr:DUF4041 domain-containing protein [Lapidilactobacillus luobeiensis]